MYLHVHLAELRQLKVLLVIKKPMLYADSSFHWMHANIDETRTSFVVFTDTTSHSFTPVVIKPIDPLNLPNTLLCVVMKRFRYCLCAFLTRMYLENSGLFYAI